MTTITKNIAGGFFTMDTVHTILKTKSLDEAKQLTLAIIKTSTEARQKSIDKAITMVHSAKSIANLAQSITNFMLAHPSENLKTL